VADLAYQVTGNAYQGSGLFAYQGSVDGSVSVTPAGVRRGRKREVIVNLADVQSRESTADFLKSQLRLRHPASAFIDEPDKSAEIAARAERQAREAREKVMRDEAAALEAAAQKRAIQENNEAAILLATLLSELDD
jgi:hypothetical protein